MLENGVCRRAIEDGLGGDGWRGTWDVGRMSGGQSEWPQMGQQMGGGWVVCGWSVCWLCLHVDAGLVHQAQGHLPLKPSDRGRTCTFQRSALPGRERVMG